MGYDFGGRILEDNQRYHKAMFDENARHHHKTTKEQKRMRHIMEAQTQRDDARALQEQLLASQAQTLQKIVETFQRTMAQGTRYLEEGAYPAAIAEFTDAKDAFFKKRIKVIGEALEDQGLLSYGHFSEKLSSKWDEISPEYYYNVSLAYLLNKDFSSAITNASMLIEKEPNNYKAYNLRAKAAIRLARREHTGDYPASVERDLTKSLSLSPNQETIVARLDFINGDFPEAIQRLERLVVQREVPLPERIELLELLGDAYSATGAKEKALEAYESSLSILPNHLQYYEQIEILRTKRGDIFLEKGQEEEALAEYQKAHEKNTNNPLCFIREAKSGNVEKQLLLAEAYFQGSPAIKKNWTQSKEWFLKCSKKKNCAYSFLGEMHETGGFGLVKSSAEAVRFYQKSTDGNVRYNAGQLFLNGGEGLAASKKDAIKCFRYAAKHANSKLRTEAAFELGKLLSTGEGCSFQEALHFYQTVADSTEEEVGAAEKTEAAFAVGLWYLEGRDGVPKNLTASYKYLSQAYSSGLAQAKEPYARMLFEVAETYSHDHKAKVLANYTIAADLGHAMAAFRAGELFRLGAPGISKNTKQARTYLKMAVDRGITEAEAPLKETNSFCVIL